MEKYLVEQQLLFRFLKETNNYKNFKEIIKKYPYKNFKEIIKKASDKNEMSDIIIDYDGIILTDFLPLYVDRFWCVLCGYLFEDKDIARHRLENFRRRLNDNKMAILLNILNTYLNKK